MPGRPGAAGDRMLAAVTFDCWQTLIADDEATEGQARRLRITGCREALERGGVAVGETAVAAAYDAAGEALATLWASGRDVSTEAQVRLLLGRLDGALAGEPPARLLRDLAAAYAAPVLEALPSPCDGAAEALAWVAARGLRLGLICNTGRTPGRTLRPALARRHMLRYLHACTFSDEVGLRKPDPRLFHATLGALEVAADAAVHVGDDPVADVAGAKRVGMRAVYLCRKSGTRQAAEADATIRSLRELPAVLAAWAGEGAG
ncbi:MAG: HAD family hydrolase [candidate division NC10 bacterium]|nr:HAD family hydrolase [candidate division NC10 bacterium]